MWFLFVGQLTYDLQPKMFIPCRCIFLFGIAFVGKKRLTKKIEQKSTVESHKKRDALALIRRGCYDSGASNGWVQTSASTTLPASAKCGDTGQPPQGKKSAALTMIPDSSAVLIAKKLGEEPFLLTFTKKLIFDSDLGKPVPGGKPQVPKVPQQTGLCSF